MKGNINLNRSYYIISAIAQTLRGQQKKYFPDRGNIRTTLMAVC